MSCDSQNLQDAAVCTNVAIALPWEVTGQHMSDQPPPDNICCWEWAFACWKQLYQFDVSFAGDASL